MSLRMDLVQGELAILKPKQPYVNWLNVVSPLKQPRTLENERQQGGVALLIPQFEELWDGEKYIQQIYLELFEQKLSRVEDQNLWPMVRNYQTFNEWFEVELYWNVWDTCQGEIGKEEDEP